MAKKSQCEQCDRYNQESGLCRKNWHLIEFDDTECEFFGKCEPAKVEVLESELGAEPQDETVHKSEPSPDQYADLRQRHGCATTWIFLMFSVHLFLIFFRLYNIIFQDLAEEQITENISGIIVSLIIIVAVFLLFKWKIWGLYIMIGLALFDLGTSIIFLGKLSNSFGPIAIMFVAFSMKAKDGRTFLENLGFMVSKIRSRYN